jgi:hypothetical protein
MDLMIDQFFLLLVYREQIPHKRVISDLFWQLHRYAVTNTVTISILESLFNKISNIQRPLNVTAFLVYPVTVVTSPLLLKRRIFHAAY